MQSQLQLDSVEAQEPKTMQQSTSRVVTLLKESDQDFEWYPTTDHQIQTITDDINRIGKVYDFQHGRDERLRILDIGAGDGRVLLALQKLLNADKGERDSKFKAYAIEKASVHTSDYAEKNITLLGTDFYETNLISKNAMFAFVNPPYSDFSTWVARIIQTLRFNVLYAVIPARWVEDEQIKAAMKNRSLGFAHTIAESDFEDGERKARAKVHLVRFSFVDLTPEAIQELKKKQEERFQRDRQNWRYYQPSLSKDATCPFQLFIEQELGLHQTHSETTEKFREYQEKERIREAMNDGKSECYEIAQSRGILWALLDSYEKDLQTVLAQYKLIGQLDGQLLAELGVEHKAIVEGVKEKLFGFRNVYWALLFDHLDAIKEKLISAHKERLLQTLSANALDFTYTNAVYIIKYAVDMANGLIEESLVDVFKELTSPDSIQSYYKSNEHVLNDDWRYNLRHGEDKIDRKCKRMLDYRFVSSHWGNFGNHSWDRGLNDDARKFTDDLIVVFRLLGYSSIYTTESYEHMVAGDKLFIMGTHPDGDNVELLKIRFYKNGNRHLSFNQEAMLRFNVTVSRILGWVRSKAQFCDETETDVKEDIWATGDNLKILPSTILKLTDLSAA